MPSWPAHRQRLWQIEKELKLGHVPKVRKYTPGLQELLERYGVADQVYIPRSNLSEKENYENAKRFYQRRRYQAERRFIGGITSIRQGKEKQREIEYLEQHKKLILARLTQLVKEETGNGRQRRTKRTSN